MIPEGQRWTTLNQFVSTWPSLNLETLRFLCTFVWDPLFKQEDKISSWISYLESRENVIQLDDPEDNLETNWPSYKVLVKNDLMEESSKSFLHDQKNHKWFKRKGVVWDPLTNEKIDSQIFYQEFCFV